MLKRLIFFCLCTFVVLLMLASQGSSLKCYQCNSYINKSCERIDEKEDAIFLQPCGEEHVICRMEYHTIRGEYRVIRTCGKTKHRKPCYLGTSQDLKSQTCQCEKDGCNTAVKAESSIVKLVSVVLISLYLLR